MAQLMGLTVRLTITTAGYAGTDDTIYIGMFGRKGGGREFALRSALDDYEPGSDVRYVFGVPASPGSGFIRATNSAPGGRSDPGQMFLRVEDIEYVYLRKQAYGIGGADDAMNLNGVSVNLRDADDGIFGGRQFSGGGAPGAGLWLANEYGHCVWLYEFGV